MTCEMWHVTCDTEQVTHEKWQVWGRWTFSQNFSFIALTVWEWRCFEELRKRMIQLVNEWINVKGVCRTAPATQSLLINRPGAVSETPSSLRELNWVNKFVVTISSKHLHSQALWARKLTFLKKVQLSHATCHMSHVTCQVIFCLSLFLTNWWS